MCSLAGDGTRATKSRRLMAERLAKGRPAEDQPIWSPRPRAKPYRRGAPIPTVRSWSLKTSQAIERESISLLGAALSLQGFGV